MTTTPPPDWRNIPGAGRAHLIDPPGPKEPPSPRPNRLRPIFTKPLVWVLGLLLAAIGGFVINYLAQSLEKEVREATSDPVLVYDVQQIDPPPRDEAGYVVPDGEVDPGTVRWGGNGSADHGGVPEASWVFEQGGLPAGWGAWEVVVEANRDKTITITAIRAENIECEAPTGGTHFIFATQGQDEPSNLGITVDAPSPEFKVLPQDWYLLPDPDPDAALASFATYGQDTVITLEPNDQKVIRFFAHAAEQTCRWDVELEYAADGARQTASLTPEGEHAFALAALLPIDSYETVVIPWTYCSDYEGRVLPGPEAAAIVTEMNTGGGTVDCP
ncbi:hypothetical protein GCM10009853_100580 [Glycomyces scopariae]